VIVAVELPDETADSDSDQADGDAPDADL